MRAELGLLPRFLPDDTPPPLVWELYVWAAPRLAWGWVRRVRAWLDRPVTNVRPVLAPAKPAGRHRPGETTIRFSVIQAREGQPMRIHREPRLLGTDPLHVWTHPERYGKPVAPDFAAATAAAAPDFAEEA